MTDAITVTAIVIAWTFLLVLPVAKCMGRIEDRYEKTVGGKR